MSWKKYSLTKKGFLIGFLIGLFAFVVLILYWGLQPLYSYGQVKCTNFHSSLWECDLGFLGIYLVLSIVAGILMTIVSAIFGLFIGWSIENKRVLKGQFIGIITAIILELLIIFLSLILPKSNLRKFLFGDYTGFKIGYFFESFLVLLILGIGIGAIIGFIISKIKGVK